jgi:hypothetical protein
MCRKAIQGNLTVEAILLIEAPITVKIRTVDSRDLVPRPMGVPSHNNEFEVAISATCSGPHQVAEAVGPIKANRGLFSHHSRCLRSRHNIIPQTIACLRKSMKMTIPSVPPKICRSKIKIQSQIRRMETPRRCHHLPDKQADLLSRRKPGSSVSPSSQRLLLHQH